MPLKKRDFCLLLFYFLSPFFSDPLLSSTSLKLFLDFHHQISSLFLMLKINQFPFSPHIFCQTNVFPKECPIFFLSLHPDPAATFPTQYPNLVPSPTPCLPTFTFLLQNDDSSINKLLFLQLRCCSGNEYS